MLASATDAFVALHRIGNFMRAEELAIPYEIDPNADAAIDVDGDFTWETVRKDATNGVRLGAKFDKGGTGKREDRRGRRREGGGEGGGTAADAARDVARVRALSRWDMLGSVATAVNAGVRGAWQGLVQVRWHHGRPDR